MYNPLMLLPAFINLLVTGMFMVVVARQYLQRRRSHQLLWTIAMSMAFTATLCYILMIIVGPTTGGGILLFRSYYILGGAIMPAWLGLGSVALATTPRFTRVSVSLISLCSLIAAAFILDARVDVAQLQHVAGTPGTGILQRGPWLITIILLNTLGVVAIAGIALYSGWKLVRRQTQMAGYRPLRVLWANMLILAGALLNGAAGSLARFLAHEETFWLIMAAGWFVLFAGVLLASRRSSRAQPVSGESQDARQLAGTYKK